MTKKNDIPCASEVVTAADAIEQINTLIESGFFSTYTQICLIRAINALSHQQCSVQDDIEMAEIRKRYGDD